MIQNEFRFIGTVVSDFEEVGNMSFPKKKFSLEVERKKGKVDTFSITVHGTNKVIDTSKSLFGSVVIVGGYIDIYNNYISLIAQDITTVGVTKRGRPVAEPVEIKPENTGVVDVKDINVTEQNEDDDLPF